MALPEVLVPPDGLDPASTLWMLLCAALVLLMTPGLAAFYAGLVWRKNSVNMLFMNLIALAIGTVFYFVIGFGLQFGPSQGGFIASGKNAALWDVMIEPSPFAPHIPFIVFFLYQCMFAVITPLLITGAYADRMTFSAFLIWDILWTLLVYCPIVHWVFGGGFMMEKWGVADYGGGLSVHAAAGAGALASALWFPRRPQEDFRSHNVPLVAVGFGLLWFGWLGFNGGGAFALNDQAVTSVIGTHVAGAGGMLIWMLLEWKDEGKPKLVGAIFGAVAGLAASSAASGHVQPWAALVTGILGSTISYFNIKLQYKIGFDDTLNVWAVHWTCGTTGIICIGLFGDASIGGVNGVIHGDGKQLGFQILAAIVVSLWSFCWSYAILVIMSKLGFEVAISDEDQKEGVDATQHDEIAYDDDAGVTEEECGFVVRGESVGGGQKDGYNRLAAEEETGGTVARRQSFEVSKDKHPHHIHHAVTS